MDDQGVDEVKWRVSDYVKWRNVEGWIYYIDETHLTIEISGEKPKADNLVPMHKKHHCLIVVNHYNGMNLYM